MEEARTNMIKQQLHTWEVIDEQVLKLFEILPRERFLPAKFRDLAYSDLSIPLGYDQTTMSPKEEARMIQALQVQPTDRVLVLGTNDGYITAVLAKMASWVFSISAIEAFAEHAKEILDELHIYNVTLTTSTIAQGLRQAPPYDVIMCTGSFELLPPSLQQFLNVNGRLLVIVGNEPMMDVVLIKRISSDEWKVDKIFQAVRPRLLTVEKASDFEF